MEEKKSEGEPKERHGRGKTPTRPFISPCSFPAKFQTPLLVRRLEGTGVRLFTATTLMISATDHKSTVTRLPGKEQKRSIQRGYVCFQRERERKKGHSNSEWRGSMHTKIAHMYA
jgi:hypothetical protein